MSKLIRKKTAVTLAFAALFGNKILAMNNTSKSEVKSPETLGTVRGARNQTKKINWKKIAKIGGSSVVVLAALEAIHSIFGGFTDFGIGKGSIGRAIRNRVKKNNQPDSGKQGDKNPEQKSDKSGQKNYDKKNLDKELHDDDFDDFDDFDDLEEEKNNMILNEFDKLNISEIKKNGYDSDSDGEDLENLDLKKLKI